LLAAEAISATKHQAPHLLRNTSHAIHASGNVLGLVV
jgi:hypothetical protein